MSNEFEIPPEVEFEEALGEATPPPNSDSVTEEAVSEEKPKRKRRGRPKGSKNRKKKIEEPVESVLKDDSLVEFFQLASIIFAGILKDRRWIMPNDVALAMSTTWTKVLTKHSGLFDKYKEEIEAGLVTGSYIAGALMGAYVEKTQEVAKTWKWKFWGRKETS